jgi:hypothetical protein
MLRAPTQGVFTPAKKTFNDLLKIFISRSLLSFFYRYLGEY